jgi:hypothetical protein
VIVGGHSRASRMVGEKVNDFPSAEIHGFKTSALILLERSSEYVPITYT